jgi:glyoxylase-like metal-dependent hydrolase (beta-lactamase superfamily II)
LSTRWLEGSLILVTLPVGLIQTNCYVVGCPETKQGAIIDPGGDAQRILGEVERQGLAIQYVLNTHGHFDHTDANGSVVKATCAPLAIHPLDKPLLQAAGGAAWFGMAATPSPPPDRELQDGDELKVGKLSLRVLHTPGHTPGHVSFYEPVDGILLDGDVLFYRGIGRTDLPGGDFRTLLDSIRRVLFSLPESTLVYSGHGPATTIGDEKRLNPWLTQ